jgi:hypothetical protein
MDRKTRKRRTVTKITFATKPTPVGGNEQFKMTCGLRNSARGRKRERKSIDDLPHAVIFLLSAQRKIR